MRAFDRNIGPVTEIPNVAVPEALLRDADAFGGRRDAGCRVGHLQLAGGVPVGMVASEAPAQRVVLPRLTEAHVHLDKCHTIERCAATGGDLAAAAAAQLQDKARWTESDLQARMRRGLDELIAAGCGTVRTHIDWGANGATAPLAWAVACDLRDAVKPLGVTLQVAALTGIDEMADLDAATSVAQRVAQDGGVLGSFVLNHLGKHDGLRNLFNLADRFGLALDFHVDEGLDPALDGLDSILGAHQSVGFEGPVLCGHACSLATRPAEDVARLAEGLATAGIAVATLPTTNLYLQGRGAGTPTARGLTRVHELRASGVDVVVGTDNVRDPFCPIGLHDPCHSLGVAVLAGHLDPPLASHLPMITTTAQKALGLPQTTIDQAPANDLLAFDVPDISSLLSQRPAPQPLTHFVKGETRHG